MCRNVYLIGSVNAIYTNGDKYKVHDLVHLIFWCVLYFRMSEIKYTTLRYIERAEANEGIGTARYILKRRKMFLY